MIAIVAVDKNWNIGKGGQLLFHIPQDMKRFSTITRGKIVIYGRKTLETFPKRLPLKDRYNIVISEHLKDHDIESLCSTFGTNTKRVFKCASSPESAIDYACEYLRAYPPFYNENVSVLNIYTNQNVCVIGGESIYKALLDYCDTFYVTKVDKEYTDADRKFPINLDKNPEIYKLEYEDFDFVDEYSFCKYTRLYPIYRTMIYK